MASPSIFRESNVISFTRLNAAMSHFFGSDWKTAHNRRFRSPNQWRIWAALMGARNHGKTVWIEDNLEPGFLVIYVGEIEKINAGGKRYHLKQTDLASAQAQIGSEELLGRLNYQNGDYE